MDLLGHSNYYFILFSFFQGQGLEIKKRDFRVILYSLTGTGTQNKK